MKKLLIGVLALCSLFAFAACGADGKCDECGATGEDVINYDGGTVEVDGIEVKTPDLGGEYCAECAEKVMMEKLLNGELDADDLM
ncbi:MAG: hypothetical protein IJF44_01000 [Clostridia bacterium]|nr:hypothetical protein [Clostridia bacterium]